MATEDRPCLRGSRPLRSYGAVEPPRILPGLTPDHMKSVFMLVLTLLVLSMFFPTAYGQANELIVNLLTLANDAVGSVSTTGIPQL
jgi:hypothetical protein